MLDNYEKGILSFIDEGKNISTFIISKDTDNAELNKYIKKHEKTNPIIAVTYNKANNLIEYLFSSKIYVYAKEYNVVNSKVISLDLMSILNMHEKEVNAYDNLKSYALKKGIVIDGEIESTDSAKDINEKLALALYHLYEENKDVVDFVSLYAVKHNKKLIKTTPTKIILQNFIDSNNIQIKSIQQSSVIGFKELNINEDIKNDEQLYDKIKDKYMHEFNDITYIIRNIPLSIKPTGVYYASNDFLLTNNNNVVAYIDFKSFFSSIMLKYKITPYYFDHVKDKYIEYIQKLVDLKDNSKTFGRLYKKILLNIVGIYNHQSLLYSPKTFYEITINGVYEMIKLINDIMKVLPTINIINVRIDGIFIEINKLQKDVLISFVNSFNQREKYLRLGLEFYSKAFIDKQLNYILIKEVEPSEQSINKDDFEKMIKNVFCDLNTVTFTHEDKHYSVKTSQNFNTKEINRMPLISKYAILYKLLFNGSIMKIIMNNSKTPLLYAYVKNVSGNIICSDKTILYAKDKTNTLVVSVHKNNCVFEKNPTIMPLSFVNDNTKFNFSYYIDTVSYIDKQDIATLF